MAQYYVESVTDEYLRSLAAAKPADTYRTYSNSLHRFTAYCALREVAPIETPTALIEHWIADRLKEVARNTVYTDLAGLKYFYAWAVERGYREDNPAASIRMKRDRRLPTKPTEAAQLGLLLRACRCERDKLLVLSFAATGCRVSELAQMRVEHIDWSDSTIGLLGKGGKQRQVVIPSNLAERLRAFLGRRRSGAIWMSDYGQALKPHQIRKIVYRIGAAAGVDDLHPHRFRAGFATSFLEQTGDIQALQVIMGHENIATTARYTEYTRTQRAMDLMRRHNPIADVETPAPAPPEIGCSICGETDLVSICVQCAKPFCQAHFRSAEHLSESAH